MTTDRAAGSASCVKYHGYELSSPPGQAPSYSQTSPCTPLPFAGAEGRAAGERGMLEGQSWPPACCRVR